MKQLFLMIKLLLIPICVAWAQDDKGAINQLVTEDSADVYQLATYPENVRQDIFEAAAAPKALADIQDAQKKSNEQFRILLDPYSMTDQRKIWDIVRYNGLVKDLVSSGKESKEEYEQILKKYPAEIHDNALYYARHDFKLLKKINQLNSDFTAKFESIISSYPAATQNAFRNLLNKPEIISILNNNLNVTVRLGNIYQRNPELLKAEFRSLNTDLAEQKKKDIAAWQQKMKDDPEAEKEMEQAAKDYAQDQGQEGDNYYAPADQSAVNNYTCEPYPYWCGFPWWYDYEYWYPFPVWWDWGFYYWGGRPVWFGLPGWGFMHWFYWHSGHFFGYPHLANAYFGFYYGQHRANAYGGVVVHQWLRENQRYLPKDFAQNEKGRVEALKEYGRFSDNYAQHRAENGGKSMMPGEYLSQHASEYPHLQQQSQEHAAPAAEHGNAGRPEATPSRSSGERPTNTNTAPREEWINNGSRNQPSYHSAPRYSTPGGGGSHGGGGGGGGFHGGGGGGGRH